MVIVPKRLQYGRIRVLQEYSDKVDRVSCSVPYKKREHRDAQKYGNHEEQTSYNVANEACQPFPSRSSGPAILVILVSPSEHFMICSDVANSSFAS